MPANTSEKYPENRWLWAGCALSGLLVLFFAFISVMNILKPNLRLQEYTQFGYSSSVIVPVGATLLLCTILYALPQTTVLGAILLTGYFGGAIVTHMRIGQRFWFEIMFGVLIWLGLYLREPRVRELIPIRRP